MPAQAWFACPTRTAGLNDIFSFRRVHVRVFRFASPVPFLLRARLYLPRLERLGVRNSTLRGCAVSAPSEMRGEPDLLCLLTENFLPAS